VNNTFINYVLSIIFLLCTAPSAYATTIEQLLASDELKVQIQASTTGEIIPRQKVTFKIEVLSANAFKENIELSYSNIDNVVVLPPSPQITRETRQINDQEWFVQTKELILYPLIKGEFTIPPIGVNIILQINDEQQLAGELTTTAQQFVTSIPSSMQADNNYIATQKMTVTREQNNEIKKQLAVGNAVSHTYEITTDDMNSLMLPDIVIAEQEGVKIYRKVIQNNDKYNRKSKMTQGHKVEEITYIFEQEGRYSFPEQHFIWWDVNQGKRHEIILPEQQFTVGENGTELPTGNEKVTGIDESWISEISVLQWIYYLVFITFLIAVIILIIRHREHYLAYFHRLNKSEIKQLTRQYYKNISTQQFQCAIVDLYQLANTTVSHSQALKNHLTASSNELNLLEKLQKLAFSNKKEMEHSFTVNEARLLLNRIMFTNSKRLSFNRFKFLMALNADK